MLTGSKHALQLAVSLFSLRQQYDGSVTVLCGDDAAWDIAKQMARDAKLGDTSFIKWRSHSGQRGIQYANKCEMFWLTPYGRTIFLDADTLVVKPLTNFWPDNDRVHLTQFADWITTGKIMRGRLEPWRDAEPERVAEQLKHPYKAVNTGVIAFGENTEAFHHDWRGTTHKRISFICDELAAQIIAPSHQNCTVWSAAYNRSPVHGEDDQRQTVIYHGHGWKFMKRERGRAIWLPYLAEAAEQNWGNLRDWFPAKDPRVRHLTGPDNRYQVTDEERRRHTYALSFIHNHA